MSITKLSLIWLAKWAPAVYDLSQKGGGRVCEYMHAGAIYYALTWGRTEQKDGSNSPTSRQIIPLAPVTALKFCCLGMNDYHIGALSKLFTLLSFIDKYFVSKMQNVSS